MRRILVVVLAFAASRAWADAPGVAVTSDWITGNGYRGWDGKGRVDFGDRPDWSLNGSFAWAHAHGGTESLSKQASVGLEHASDDNWSFRGSLTGWRDYISDVRYAGPSWGVTYTALESAAPRKADEEESSTPDELFGVSFDNDLYFYHAPESLTARRVRVHNRPVVIPASSGSVNLAQWHPGFELEKPLFHQDVVPSVTFGHYFYSKDPGVIESRAGAPRFSASAGSLSSLAGGLFKNDVTPALDVLLPWHCRLHGSLALSQSATDNTWSVTQELSAKTTVAHHVSVKGKWDHTIQAGQGTDQYAVGLTVLF